MWSHTYPLAALLWCWVCSATELRRVDNALESLFGKNTFQTNDGCVCACLLFALSYGSSAGKHLINQNKTFIGSKYCRCVSYSFFFAFASPVTAETKQSGAVLSLIF